MLFKKTPWYGGIAILGIVLCIPWNNYIAGDGTLEPETIRDVCTEHTANATVKEHYVEFGQQVEVGQPLCRLEDPTIIEKIKKLQTEISIAQSEAHTHFVALHNSQGNLKEDERAKTIALKLKYTTEAKNKKAELDHLLRIKDGLELKSTVAGHIIEPKNMEGIDHQTYDPQKPIMRIAASGSDWYVGIYVPEAGANEINSMLVKNQEVKVKFYLHQDKRTAYYGEVEKVSISQDQASEDPKAEKKVFVKVKFDNSNLGLDQVELKGSLRGAKVTALFQCGKMPLGIYLTKSLHDHFWWVVHRVL